MIWRLLLNNDQCPINFTLPQIFHAFELLDDVFDRGTNMDAMLLPENFNLLVFL